MAAFCEVLLGKVFQPQAEMPTGDGDRQDDAATGNLLPEKDEDADPALAWLFGAPPVLIPVPTQTPVAAAGPALVPVDPTAKAPLVLEAAPDFAPDVIMASGAPGVKPTTIDPQANCEVIDAKPRMFTLPLAAPGTSSDVASQPVKLPLPQPLPPTDAASSRQQPVKPSLLRPQPPVDRAANPQSVAAALPALFALSMTSERQPRSDDPLSSFTPATAVVSQPGSAVPVAPMGDVPRHTLDMGRQDWPQKMIDHIEALRDNANANDTSIRLKPEALGRVDIALRTHDDGAISIRFSAEQSATRTMLIDATPQLSAAADARGIRLSGTSVDLSGQGDQRPQPQNDGAPDRAQSAANRLATERGDDSQAADDGRIA